MLNPQAPSFRSVRAFVSSCVACWLLVGCGSGGTLPSSTPGPLITVSGNASTRLGTTTQFVATVSGLSSTAVTWSVNGTPGGNVATGTISSGGLYTAPASLPAGNSVAIQATSVSTPGLTGAYTESLFNPLPVLGSATAVEASNTLSYSVDVLGTGFVPTSSIQVAGAAQATTYISATELQTTFTAVAGTSSIQVAVINPDPGGSISKSIAVGLAQPVSVTVTGAAATRLGTSAQFSATVNNATNQTVTWQVNGVTGGSAGTGTITAAGLYSAPAGLPTGNVVTIQATSVSVPSAAGTLLENVQNPIPVENSATTTESGNTLNYTVDLLGSSFVNGATVQAGTTTLTTTFISSTELKAAFTGTSATTSIAVTVTNPNPGSSTSNTVSASVTPPVTVTVTGAASTRLGSVTQFSATVSNSTNQTVNWQVNGVTGGNAATGTISAAGLYSAPSALPAGNAVIVQATSSAQPAATGAMTENLQNPVPVAGSATTAESGNTLNYTVDVLGSNFVSGATVQSNGTALTTTFISPSELKATTTVTSTTTSLAITVTNPDPGSSTSNVVTASVALPLSVTVSGAASARLGTMTQFIATVANSSNQTVTWQVNGVTGGSAATGTITAAGLYTAPAALPAGNAVTIQATSMAMPSATGSLTESLLNPVPVASSVTATSVGNTLTYAIDVLGSNFVNGATIQSNGTTLTTTFVSSGEVKASFTVSSTTTSLAVMVTNPDPGSSVSNMVTATVTQPVAVTVTGAASTRLGATTQFTATVSNTTNQAVTWQVNGVTGGNATVGTITTAGLYSAPATLPSGNAVTIQATSSAVPSATGSVPENILNPVPVANSGTTAETGTTLNYTIDVHGTNFVNGATVQAGSTTLTTTFVSSVELTAVTTVTSTTTSLSITVTNPNPGSSTSNAVTATVVQPVTVSVSGYSTTRIGASTQFTATVTNTTNAAVTWQVNGVTGGNAMVGTISSTGLYAAPATIPSGGTVTIQATSTASPSSMGTLSETILNPAPDATNATATQVGSTVNFLITVNGSGFLPTSVMVVNGTSQTTTYISATQLQTTTSPAVGTVSVPVAVVNPDPGGSASNSVTATYPVSVSVSGGSSTRLGSTTQFTASVFGTATTTVTWSVNGSVGGSSTAGTISSTGLYTAPAGLNYTTVTIAAVSTVSSTASASLQEALLNPLPMISTATATQTGTSFLYTLDVMGSGFVPSSVMDVGGTAVTTTYVSSTEIRGSVTVTATTTSLTITVVNPNPGGSTSNPATVPVSPTVIVTVTGPATTLLGANSQFSANVSNSSSQSVTWAVNGTTGGSTTYGIISATGLYTAPATLPSPDPVTITATSVAYPGSSGSLSETVTSPVPVVISIFSTLKSGTSYSLDVLGSGFGVNSVIQSAGVNLTTTFVSTTELTATATIANITAGTLMDVVTPAPGGGASNSLTEYQGEAFAAYPLSGTYVAPPTTHPFVITSAARETQFLIDALTDTSKAAALASLQNYTMANVAKASTWETVYDGLDLYQYQTQFSVFDNGVNSSGATISPGAAPVASRFALFAYLSGLNLACKCGPTSFGNASLAAVATTAANTILYNWATTGFEVTAGGAYINSYSQFYNSTDTVDPAGEFVELQIGRGMNDYIAAEDVIYNTQTTTQQQAITAFIQRQETLITGAFNYYYDYNYSLTCGRYDNQPSTGMESLAEMGRYLGDSAMIQAIAGTGSATLLRWSFPQQIEGTIYGTNDPVRNCYAPPTTTIYRYNTVTAAGEVIDRYRNEGAQPFGYTSGNQMSLQIIARVLANSGYSPAAFVGGRGQSLQTALEYYSFYLINFVSYAADSIPASGTNATYDAYPDFAQYATDQYSVAGGATLTAAADFTTQYVLGQNLYPSDAQIQAALNQVRAVAKANNVIPFYQMSDMTLVEAWEP